MGDRASCTFTLSRRDMFLAARLDEMDEFPAESEWPRLFQEALADASFVRLWEESRSFEHCVEFVEADVLGGGYARSERWAQARIPFTMHMDRHFEWPCHRAACDGQCSMTSVYEYGWPVVIDGGVVSDESMLRATMASRLWASAGRVLREGYDPSPPAGSMMRAWLEFLASKTTHAPTAAMSAGEDLPLPYDLP